ncbi:MAG: hypothetical protein COA33_007045 [Fluviicola sp.]|nr:hypothetical protein [Fluviicola sp.]
MKKSNPSKTVLTIVVGFIGVYFLTKMKWPLTIATVIGLTGVLSSYLSEKIDWLWMKIGWVLSFIVPNIILTIIFFFFLFPISILYRIFRKEDPFKIKRQNESLYVSEQKVFEKESFERMY